MQSLNLFFAFIVLFAIIAINILFDMIGTAVQSAEEKPFHSLAARKVKGARESISVIRHAPQLANLCCDVTAILPELFPVQRQLLLFRNLSQNLT